MHIRDAHPITAPRVLDPVQPQSALAPVQPEQAQVPVILSEASTECRSKEAAKADSASVPIFIWDQKVGLNRGRSGKQKDVSKGQIRKALLFVRNNRLHARWCTKVAMSFWKHVVEEKRLCKVSGATFDTRIYKAGLVSIEYALKLDWWEWKRGRLLSSGDGQNIVNANFAMDCLLDLRDHLQSFIEPKAFQQTPKQLRRYEQNSTSSKSGATSQKEWLNR
jgi:hypothetical protein